MGEADYQPTFRCERGVTPYVSFPLLGGFVPRRAVEFDTDEGIEVCPIENEAADSSPHALLKDDIAERSVVEDPRVPPQLQLAAAADLQQREQLAHLYAALGPPGQPQRIEESGSGR